MISKGENKMKKTIFTTISTIIVSIACLNVQASLINGSTLSIDSGSYFEFLDTSGTPFGQISITGIDGVMLGSSQSHDFSFTGDRIDDFMFLGAYGMHYTTSNTNVINSSGNTATIDFSGWSWAFNGAAASFNLGSGSWGTNPDGIAEIICNVDCGNGDTYTLYYTATSGDEPSGFANLTYELHLTGTVSAVPVPAAVWLFGSGLIGLIGVARIKKS